MPAHESMHPSELIIVLGFAVATIAVGMAFFRHYQVVRPPIGVFNAGDVVVLMLAVVAIPYLYLVLPLWAVVGVLAPTTVGVILFTLEAMRSERALRWLLALGLVSADFALALTLGVDDQAYLLVNNLVVLVLVVGIANLWVQSGMRARHLATLAVLLALYDFVATSQLTLMSDLLTRLENIPLGPFLAWTVSGHSLAIGLGDLLLATAYPLAVRKAYGVKQAAIALTVAVVVIAGVLAYVGFGAIEEPMPVMVVLGPLILVQDLFWRRGRAAERTTRQYLLAEPTEARPVAA